MQGDDEDMQPPVTLEYGGGTETIIQHQTKWLDTLGFTYVNLTTQITASDAAGSALVLETADAAEATWSTVGSYSNVNSSSPQELVLTTEAPYSSYNRLRRFVRWRWSPPLGAGTYYMSFRIRAVRKP